MKIQTNQMKIKAIAIISFIVCLAMLANFCFAQSSLTNGLVSYWKFDESSGNAFDSKGSNTLTNGGSAPFSSSYGKINNGTQLSASSSQYFGTQTGLQSVGPPYSFSLWFNAYSTVQYTGAMVSFVPNPGTRSWGYFGLNTNGTAYIAWTENGQAGLNTTSSGVNYADGNWHHIVAVLTTTTATLYVDGLQVATGSGQITTGMVLKNFVIAYQNWSYSSWPYIQTYQNFRIDEMGVWNRCLSSTEISSLYNSGKGLQYPFSKNNSIFWGTYF